MHVPEGGKGKKNLSHHVDPCRVVLVQTHPRQSSSIFKLRALLASRRPDPDASGRTPQQTTPSLTVTVRSRLNENKNGRN
jgi:hypothetical protein